MTEFILFGSLALMIFINIPIAIALGLASIFTLCYVGDPFGVVPAMMQATVQKFTLLTIPLFILAGAIMDKGGISKRLVTLANCFFGGVKGGLGIVAVIAAMFFAAISGSGTATVAAIGSVLIPAMIKEGYEPGFAAGLSAISGSLGTIIPPSITFIIYGMITGESIGDLFFAGIVPGILFGAILCLFCYLTAKKNNWGGKGTLAGGTEIRKAFIDALWGIFSPIIVLGGIYTGILTPTESAAVAVIYSFLVGAFVYKELNLKNFASALFITGKTTGIILLIIMNAGIFSWVLTEQGIAARLTNFAISSIDSKIVMLLIINIVFLCAGCVMDNTSALFILVPIVMPIAKAMGIDLVHLGVVLVLNLSIGQVTPPVGPNLYVATDIAKAKFETVVHSSIPVLMVSLLALLIITFVPWFSLCLI